jgi:hypothetical protein
MDDATTQTIANERAAFFVGIYAVVRDCSATLRYEV